MNEAAALNVARDNCVVRGGEGEAGWTGRRREGKGLLLPPRHKPTTVDFRKAAVYCTGGHSMYRPGQLSCCRGGNL